MNTLQQKFDQLLLNLEEVFKLLPKDRKNITQRYIECCYQISVIHDSLNFKQFNDASKGINYE